MLALGDQSGEFQFKHLSFQEALFVRALCLGEAAAFWATDAAAAAFEEDALFEQPLLDDSAG